MTAIGGQLVREYRQRIEGAPARVFPLLCPVREGEWLDGWAERCTLVQSGSGFAEPGCVFITSSPSLPDTTWIVTRHDPGAGLVEFARVCPGLEAVTLAITVRAEGPASAVTIRYAVTPLPGADREEVERRWSIDAFNADLAFWEASMNHFLATGTRLEHSQTG